jgi:hypothetical protein
MVLKKDYTLLGHNPLRRILISYAYLSYCRAHSNKPFPPNYLVTDWIPSNVLSKPRKFSKVFRFLWTRSTPYNLTVSLLGHHQIGN